MLIRTLTFVLLASPPSVSASPPTTNDSEVPAVAESTPPRPVLVVSEPAAGGGPGVVPLDEADPLSDALRPDPGGLTADMVAERAVAKSPQVEAAEARLQAAAARVDQTIVAYLPQLRASASYTRLSDVEVQFGSGALVGAANEGLLSTGPCPGGGGTCVLDGGGDPVGAASFQIPQVLDQFSTQASLSVPVSDYVLRMVSGLQAAHKDEDAAELSKEAERRKSAIDARVSYYNWLRAVARVAVAEDAVVTAQAQLRDAEVGLSVGVVTQADKLRIEALAAQAQRVLSQGRAFERVARENLAVIMDEPVREYRIGEDVLATAVVAADAPEMEALVERALAQRVELKSLATSEEALLAAIRSERAGYAPRLDVFGEAVYANPNQRYFPATDEWNATWAVGARLSWSINEPLATRQRNRLLQAEDRSLRAQLEALRRGIRLEVAAAHAERTNAIAAIGYATIARRANEAAYQAISQQFQAGHTTATDVIVVLQDLYAAQLQEVNARIDFRVAEAKLRYATGDPT